MYDDPRTYELAFGFREFDKEAAFLASLSERIGTGRPPASLLELGSNRSATVTDRWSQRGTHAKAGRSAVGRRLADCGAGLRCGSG